MIIKIHISKHNGKKKKELRMHKSIGYPKYFAKNIE